MGLRGGMLSFALLISYYLKACRRLRMMHGITSRGAQTPQIRLFFSEMKTISANLEACLRWIRRKTTAPSHKLQWKWKYQILYTSQESDGLTSYFISFATSKQGDGQKPPPFCCQPLAAAYRIVLHMVLCRTTHRLAFRLAAGQKPMNNFFLTCKNRSVYIFKLH